MNRAERRRQAKENHTPVAREPVLNLKQSDIDKIKAETTEEALDLAIILLLSIPVKVVHELYGWGMKKRLPEFAEAIIDEYQRFSDGEVSMEEYRDLVYEYCGMKFVFNKEG